MNPSLIAAFEFATEYEVSTLNMIRKRLFLQVEEAGRCTIEWGRRFDGHLVKHAFADLPPLSLCDDAVQRALNEFRPLAFALGFKIQDALAEGVLGASGIGKPSDLSFGDKRREIKRLRASGEVSEPDILSNNRKIGDAWWNLYFDLEPFRGAIHHTGSLIRDPDGGVTITTRRPRRLGSTLVLTPQEQGSYVRIACLVAEGVIDASGFDAMRRRLVANDVAALERLHDVAGVSEGPARLERVKLLVGERYAQSLEPYSCEIDFDEVAVAAGAPLINVEIEATATSRTLVWRIPADSYPRGKHTVREGNGEFDQWRVQ